MVGKYNYDVFPFVYKKVTYISMSNKYFQALVVDIETEISCNIPIFENLLLSL